MINKAAMAKSRKRNCKQ